MEFTLLGIENDAIFVYDLSITKEDSVLRKFLVNGFARLDADANQKLDSLQYLSYKSLQDTAMKNRKGIWVDFKGGDESEQIKIAEPEFDGIVNEVIGGNLLVIKSNKTKVEHRISMTNIRAPKCSKTFEKEKSEPWGYEAFEHMRKNYIGKTVHVKIDEMKSFKGKDDKEI